MLYNIIRYKGVTSGWVMKVLLVLFTIHYSLFTATAQDKIVHPDISYAGTPRSCVIGGIAVEGVEGYEDYVLTGLSGLTVGQEIEVPGTQITEAVKRYWRHGLFSKAQISADSIVGNKIYLRITLAMRPRVSTINYIGIKKSERDDMEAKLGIIKGSQITPNMIDRAKILAQRYFDEKGFKNAEINIVQRDDPENPGQVVLDVNIDKKDKMKVRNIYLTGNEKLSDSKIKGSFFGKGAFGKIHEAGKFSNFFKAKKFTDERYKEAKQKLIEKYNELGFRDATILEDSVWNNDEKHVNVYVRVDEGEKYYVRNITWVGNTVVTSDYLNAVLDMKKGDPYNQRLLKKRLQEDEDAASNYYYNNGYVFSSIEPVEVNIVNDSIDLEFVPSLATCSIRMPSCVQLVKSVLQDSSMQRPSTLKSSPMAKMVPSISTGSSNRRATTSWSSRWVGDRRVSSDVSVSSSTTSRCATSLARTSFIAVSCHMVMASSWASTSRPTALIIAH